MWFWCTRVILLVRGILVGKCHLRLFLSRSWLRGGGERWKTFRAIGKRRTTSLHSRRHSAWNYVTVRKYPIPVIVVNIVFLIAVPIGCQADSWNLHLGIAAWHHSVGCKRCMSGGRETQGRLRGWGCAMLWTPPKSYATRASASQVVRHSVGQLVSRSVAQ